ncbi:MAG: metalloregulator ArsR/SmtB family transcription factor [Bacteroidales bacterium]|nr:metalloregulator ArsR/SmtB family transcription factor [Bacteroidales bacterium]MDD3666961.1 metalloregulator ArsR/SmtB family transcription factor [Bacteroidales bacterium]
MKDKYTEFQNQTARFAKALGHPVRIQILEILAGQSCCYSGDLCEVLPIARSTLSQHLNELKDAGLIQGEVNPPKIKYCINRQNWEEARGLLDRLFNLYNSPEASCNALND